MAPFHWDPDTYLDFIRRELPDYEALQAALVEAAAGAEASTILELGTGSGETARRLLDAHPRAHLVGLDSSPEMLAAAGSGLAGRAVDLRERRIEEPLPGGPLPGGPYDLVASALAVHHLDGAQKAKLFGDVAGVLRAGGRFVLADVVIPEDPADAVAPIEEGYDLPSRIDEQLAWLRDAGFHARLAWQRRDLAVLVARRP